MHSIYIKMESIKTKTGLIRMDHGVSKDPSSDPATSNVKTMEKYIWKAITEKQTEETRVA
jgi:hypothetical protein